MVKVSLIFPFLLSYSKVPPSMYIVYIFDIYLMTFNDMFGGTKLILFSIY